MKAIMLINIVSVIFGVAALSNQSIAYPNHKKIMDMGPTQAAQQIKKTFLLSSILGSITLAGRNILVRLGIVTEK